MNSEKTLVHGGCTNCGYVMMHVEVVKGCLQCPNCGEWLRVSVKNRGYGTQAEILALRYAFNDLRLKTVFADAVSRNIRSQHVLEKAGFRFVEEKEGFRYYRCNRPENEDQ